MRTIRDFRCSHCGTTTERLVDTEYKVIECPECHGDALEMISMPTVRLDGTDPGFPGAYDKWARVREDNHRNKVKRDLIS